MKSILAQTVIALGLLLAVVAVSATEEVVRDQFGVRAKNAPVDPVEDYDPEKELDFAWVGMDKQTVLRGLREARGEEVRDEGILLDKPSIVPLGRGQTMNGTDTVTRARSFVFRHLDKDEANWILYPYNFTYIEPPYSSSEEEESYNSDGSSVYRWRQGNQTLPDGALISTMNTEDFPLHTYMNWIQSKTDMNLKKAKVIYDMNIAVLQIQASRESSDDGTVQSVDITYDSDNFCTAFYSSFYPKYNKCFVGVENYKKWLEENPLRGNEPVFVYVSPEDIKKGYLTSPSGENFFGMLIIPDIMMKETNYVKNLVSPLKDTIKNYVNNGGLVYTTGKGVYLAEYWELLTSGTFSTRYSLTNPNRTWQYLSGCDMVGKETYADPGETDFAESTLCFSIPRWGDEDKLSLTSLLSGAVLADPAKNDGLKTLLSYSDSDRYRIMLHDESTGVDAPLPDDRTYPAVMYKARGKGYVVVNTGNPTFANKMYQHIYNGFFLAASRPIAVDNKLVGGFNRTIPALEQFDLNVSVNVVNFFTEDMTNAKLYVYTINGTEVVPPKSCTEVTSGYPDAPTKVVTDKVYSCPVDPRLLTNTSFLFSIRIVSALVTQQKKDVVILWPHLEYVDPTRKNMTVTVSYGVKIQAAMSALLRADMNIDPSSFYPLHAKGTYIDNVMNCENKEETPALRVRHVSIVPLISPLIDILDQIRVVTALVMDPDYYKKEVNNVDKWLFPFPHLGGDERPFDYLDWDLLYDRANLLAANWDEGVKIFRESRSKVGLPSPRGIVPGDHIMNANYQTNNDDDTFLLKQFQFDDSDKFYEHAVQRLMAFLDVSTPEGAKTKWGDNIPDEERSVTYQDRGKRRILLVRHDLFFFKKYILPNGMDESYRDKYITLDKYPNIDRNTYTVKGEYGNDVPEGMIPREWTSWVSFIRHTAVNVTDIERETGGKVKLTHYVVPIHEGDGRVAGDFYHFDETTGEHFTYGEYVKIVPTFALKFDIAPDVSRRGGDMVFKFNDNDLPWDNLQTAIDNECITISADQIAVYEYVAMGNNQLRVRFKRGQMPNEAYGQASHLVLFFENTKWASNGMDSTNRTVSMDLYELHYDLSKPENGFEDWSSKTLSDVQQEFQVTLAFRLPALRFEFVINGDIEESFMNPYELREPLVRYSIYEQELESHRAVYGSAEFHPESEPSLVTKAGGFSTFTHVGTSSVPFREYVSTGTSLQIPAGTETGRVEWDDIWGRHFVQNVRSTIFEYPPIPPPLRNFVMTTTYEILDKEGHRMLGGWRSNEEVDVHVQMKLLNNYPKWFEVTACRDNRVLQDCTVAGKSCGKFRIYDTDDNFVFPQGNDDGTMYFKRGQNASYGICLSGGSVTLEGKSLSEEEMQGIMEMSLCAKEFNSDDHSCEDAHPGLPVLKRTNFTKNGTDWNFASKVLDYWPENYIKGNMWDLTHYDYDDNQFDKAYKYHMDNNLPHLGHGNTRPDNLIAFPLFKGLGYSMVYDKNYTNPRYKKYRGWWSDNLQNRDRTLVAGNKVSNDVSVGKESLIPDSEWVDISLLQNAESKVKSSERNVYSCLFNRRAVKNYISNTKVTELFNVYENNVVPVPIDFNSTYEHHFTCTREEWYDPINISQYPNMVYTETPRDWLYFGANLRGGALEDINVIYQLSPLPTEEVKYEGLAKVQDGGRFVYWNPANSKNSYLVVDNPVHVVLAKRNDIEILQELIPSYTTTFDSVVYQHFTISDPEEIEREWESSIYTNNYGYGDFTVQVYVGDAGTTALPAPGTKIRIRLTFMNNAGFDIEMLKDAISSTEISQEAINADDLMKGIVHALKRPDSYNFLKIEIPDELKDYISIAPCPDVVGIAPLFFDFEAINVVTIRDGWKGDYYLDMNISENFPDDLRGRLNEIPVKLVKEYFAALPGKGDVTGVHDYEIEVPSIVFGVPYRSDHPLWADKIFYTSGYATQVNPVASLAKPFVADQAIIVSEEDLELYHACLGRDTNPNQTVTEGEFDCLDRLFNEQLKDHKICNFVLTEDSSYRQDVSFAPCMQDHAPTFPVKVAPKDGPDVAEMHILLRTHAPQVKSGYPKVSHQITCDFLDWKNVSSHAQPVSEATVHAKGAWISLSWSVSLLSSSGLPLSDAYISPNNSGLAQVTVTLENTGDYYAYNVMFNLTIPGDVRIATEDDLETAAGAPIPDGCGINSLGSDGTMFWCNVSTVLVPNSPRSYPFRVFYTPDTRAGAGAKAKSPLNMRVIAEHSTASIDLTASAGEKHVVQDLEGPYGIQYTSKSDTNLVVLSGRRSSEYGLALTASHKLSNIRVYIWRAKTPKSTSWTTIAVTTEPTLTDDVSERFAALGGEGEVAVDYVVAVSRTKTKVTIENSVNMAVVTQSNVYEWRVSNSNLLLLLLLIPGIAIPAVIAAAIFATTKGKNKEPVKDLGMAPKQKFVPQELVDDEPVPAVEMDQTAPPPTLPQRAAPEYVPPEPAPEAPTPGKAYAIPTGPTYLRAGVGVNVVDN